MEFYKDGFDASRIDAQFAKAQSLGIAMGEPQELNTILSWLDGDHVVILLVGSLLLQCAVCVENRSDLATALPPTVAARMGFPSPLWLTRLFQRPDGDDNDDDDDDDDDDSGSCEYHGHFITLVGIDRERELAFFTDPSKRNADLCCASFSNLERARKQKGTDEDVIRVRVKRHSS
jgi:hypothetical protein